MKRTAQGPTTLVPLVVLVMALILGGCKTLENVNAFSNAAEASLQNYNGIKTSLVSEYVAKARANSYGDYSGSHLTLTTDTPGSINSGETLARAQWRDTSLKKIYQALYNYFSGLAALSADSLVRLQLDTITKPLAGGNIIDTSSLSASTINTVGTIAGKIATAILQGYRIRHVKKYIAEADPLVAALAHDMTAIFTSIAIKSIQLQQLLLDTLYNPLLKQAATPMERKGVVDEYFRAMAAIQHDRQRMVIYIQCLNIIATAHDYMYHHIEDLKQKETKLALAQFTGQLKALNAEFGKIQDQK
jgi:hypothetical protein